MNFILKFHLLFLLIVISFSNLSGQTQIQIPRNIQSAYEKGTRSLDGSPGLNYWQNSSDYMIDVRFIPSERKIIASEKLFIITTALIHLNESLFVFFRIYTKKVLPEISRSIQKIYTMERKSLK